ncbi:MAG: tetratricopeptide repeat protein [Magnetococcales bacterium]|nr:tetratricopeptide repeat protein [Magnetococcales bacterium]
MTSPALPISLLILIGLLTGLFLQPPLGITADQLPPSTEKNQAQLNRAWEKVRQAHRTLGPRHLETLAPLLALADLYLTLDRPSMAEPLLQQALNIQERHYAKTDPKAMDTRLKLVRIDIQKGRYGLVEQQLKHLLGWLKPTLGAHHRLVTLFNRELARTHLHQALDLQTDPRAHTKVITLLQSALPILERHLDRELEEVALGSKLLAERYLARGEIYRAGSYFKKTLTIREKAHGRNHPLVAQSLHDLGRFHMGQKRYSKALPHLQRALTIQKAQPHPELQRWGKMQYDLAAAYMAQDKSNQAASALSEALEVENRRLVANDLQKARVLMSLGGLLQKNNRPQEAAPLLLQSRHIAENHFRDDGAGLIRWLESPTPFPKPEKSNTQMAAALSGSTLEIQQSAVSTPSNSLTQEPPLVGWTSPTTAPGEEKKAKKNKANPAQKKPDINYTQEPPLVGWPSPTAAPSQEKQSKTAQAKPKPTINYATEPPLVGWPSPTAGKAIPQANKLPGTKGKAADQTPSKSVRNGSKQPAIPPGSSTTVSQKSTSPKIPLTTTATAPSTRQNRTKGTTTGAVSKVTTPPSPAATSTVALGVKTGFFVPMGCFSTPEFADEKLTKLMGLEVPAYKKSVSVKGTPMSCLYGGPFDSQESANQGGDVAKKQGIIKSVMIRRYKN